MWWLGWVRKTLTGSASLLPLTCACPAGPRPSLLQHLLRHHQQTNHQSPHLPRYHHHHQEALADAGRAPAPARSGSDGGDAAPRPAPQVLAGQRVRWHDASLCALLQSLPPLEAPQLSLPCCGWPFWDHAVSKPSGRQLSAITNTSWVGSARQRCLFAKQRPAGRTHGADHLRYQSCGAGG